jgi:hypothetical protein
MVASLSDILTTAKNIVSALSNLRDIYATMSGNQTSAEISAPALVFSGQGRIVRVSITTAGTTDGVLYDSSTTSLTSSPIAYVPKAANIVEIGIPVSSGAVFSPGSGQKAVVVYSTQ